MKRKKRKIFHGKVISTGEDTFELYLERYGKAYIAEIKNKAMDGYDITMGLELDWIVDTDDVVSIKVKKEKPIISKEELEKKINDSVSKYGHFFK